MFTHPSLNRRLESPSAALAGASVAETEADYFGLSRVMVPGTCSWRETTTVQARMDTTTAGHHHWMKSPWERDVCHSGTHRVPPAGPCPILPTALHHLLQPLAPRRAQTAKLPPTSSSPFQLPPRVLSSAQQSAQLLLVNAHGLFSLNANRC